MKDRKNPPMVLDIVDDFSVFKNQTKKRNLFYKKSGFDVVSNSRKKEDTFLLNGVSKFL